MMWINVGPTGAVIALRLFPGVEFDQANSLRSQIGLSDQQLRVDVKLLRQLTPGRSLDPKPDDLVEAVARFLGESVGNQQFTVAKSRVGLLFDKSVNRDVGLPGNRRRH